MNLGSEKLGARYNHKGV